MSPSPDDILTEILISQISIALRSTIDAHGDISKNLIPSVQKRLVPLILEYIQRIGIQRVENSAFRAKITKLQEERNTIEKRYKAKCAQHRALAERLGLIGSSEIKSE